MSIFGEGRPGGNCILGGQCVDGYGCTEDDGVPYKYPNCPNADQCKERYDYENSDYKKESDRREAERWKQYEESGDLDDLPF